VSLCGTKSVKMKSCRTFLVVCLICMVGASKNRDSTENLKSSKSKNSTILTNKGTVYRLLLAYSKMILHS
jgi:hypothetical protein